MNFRKINRQPKALVIRGCKAVLRFFMALFPALLRAEVENWSWDNDLLTGTVRRYTSGVRLAHLSDTAKYTDSAKCYSSRTSLTNDATSFSTFINALRRSSK